LHIAAFRRQRATRKLTADCARQKKRAVYPQLQFASLAPMSALQRLQTQPTNSRIDVAAEQRKKKQPKSTQRRRLRRRASKVASIGARGRWLIST
jgi:hypothetical protein